MQVFNYVNKGKVTYQCIFLFMLHATYIHSNIPKLYTNIQQPHFFKKLLFLWKLKYYKILLRET